MNGSRLFLLMAEISARGCMVDAKSKTNGPAS